VLARTAAPVRFYVVGSPIYRTHGSQWSATELRALARGLGVERQVGFVPFQPDPVGAYRALDAVVHASTRPEPVGLTIAEAMARGTPVIAVPAGGAGVLFRPGHDALGVSAGDVEALVDAIAGLVSDPARRWAVGQNARRTAVERFGQERLGGQLAGVYAALRA